MDIEQLFSQDFINYFIENSNILLDLSCNLKILLVYPFQMFLMFLMFHFITQISNHENYLFYI